MRKSILIAVIVALSVGAVAEPRGPSTSEERQKAKRVITQLEETPLSPSLKQDREWIFQWIKEVPDLDIRICSAILKPLTDQENSPERNALMLQAMLGSAEFVMEHPDKVSDSVAMYRAGTESMLRAYNNILKQDPTKKNPFLESLRQKQQTGKLEAYVRNGAKECSKHPVTTLTP